MVIVLFVVFVVGMLWIMKWVVKCMCFVVDFYMVGGGIIGF